MDHLDRLIEALLDKIDMLKAERNKYKALYERENPGKDDEEWAYMDLTEYDDVGYTEILNYPTDEYINENKLTKVRIKR